MSQVITALLKSPSNECPYLTVEFLRNNLPWGEDIEVGTKHFAFGRDKAKIVLECWDLILEYVNSNGSTPAIGDQQYFNISGTIWGGAVTVVKKPQFTRDGYVIEKNYLYFTYGKLDWGFGLTKAKALTGFKEEIRYVADNG